MKTQHMEKLKPYWFVLLMALLALLAYGFFAGSTGFYADDWYIIWFLKTFGAGEFNRFFAQDRPFLAYSYTLITSLLGVSPLAWQIFGVFTRLLSALAFWFALRQAWPANKPLQRWGSALFLLFPGFSEQWMSVMYSQVFLLLAGYLLSIGLTLYTLRNPSRWPLALLPGWLWMTYALFSVEYFLGLEVLRLLLAGIVLLNERSWNRQSLARAAVAWLPFAFSTLAFLIWRVFFWKSYMYAIQPIGSLIAGTPGGAAGFVYGIWLNLLEILFLAWNNVDRLLRLPITNPATWRIWGVIPLGAALVWLFRGALTGLPLAEHTSGSQRRELTQVMLVSVVVTVGGMLPFKAAGLQISLEPPYDRFMIIFGLASSLFITSLVLLIIKPLASVKFLGLLLCLALGVQFSNGYQYRQLWSQQRDFFWQLSWRIPGLKPGTTLLTDNMPFGFYYSDRSLSGALNLLYRAPVLDRRMPYILLNSRAHLNEKRKNLQWDQMIDLSERSFQMFGNTSQAVSFFYQQSECLVVLDPDLADFYLKPDPADSEGLLDLAPFSRLNLIQTQAIPAVPPQIFWGSEPAHSWCYYFQKADLARQQGDWQQALQILSAAQAEGYTPNTHLEWYPFLIAYANTGQWETAYQVVDSLFDIYRSRHALQCDLWFVLAEISSPQPTTDPGYLAGKKQLGCLP